MNIGRARYVLIATGEKVGHAALHFQKLSVLTATGEKIGRAARYLQFEFSSDRFVRSNVAWWVLPFPSGLSRLWRAVVFDVQS